MSDQQSPATLLSAGSGLIFLFALAVSVPVGLFIQLVLLPIMLPGLHAGHGLLLGGDWNGFHADAVTLSEKIARQGWGHFELRPRGQAPIGIAAVIYTITGIREPWILVPLHGIVFALCVTGLFNIYRRIAGVRLAAIAAALLVAFPSSVLLYAQIHKDVWSIAGSLWLLYVLLTYVSLPRISLRMNLALLAITTLAVMSVWLVRSYVLQLLLVGLLTATLFLLVWTLAATRFRQVRQEASRWIGIVLCSCLVFGGAFDWPSRLAGFFSPSLATFMAPPHVVGYDSAVYAPIMIPPAFANTLKPEQRELLTQNRYEELLKSLNSDQLTVWNKQQEFARYVVEGLTPDQLIAAWIPQSVQLRLETAINLRRGQVISALSAGSAIDYDAPMRNAADMLRYAPRALQIALFAPFPDMWFKPGVSPGAGAMRAVAGVETMISYVLFAGFLPLLLLANIEQRKRIIFACVFVLPILCILAITIPNIGTLYRMRYGYFYLLIGFGIIGWGFFVRYLARLRESRSPEIS